MYGAGLVAPADREHASAKHNDKACARPPLAAPIREHPDQLVGQAETLLGHREKHHAPFEVRRSSEHFSTDGALLEACA